MTASGWKKNILSAFDKVGIINLIQKTGHWNSQFLYVLTYHRVEDPTRNNWLSDRDISASPEQFESQMKLVSEKYHPVSAEEVLSAVRGGPPLPKDALLVTVDDGYHSFFDTIHPICQRYGISPLLFLATGFVGNGTFWWDKVYQIVYLSGKNELETLNGRLPISTPEEKEATLDVLLHELKQTRFEVLTDWVDKTHSSLVDLTEEKMKNTVTWEELRELSEAGVTVACHTHTHPIMTQISIEEARQEVRLSQEMIRSELGKALPIFAFPDGKPRAVSSALIDMLNEEGFEMIFLMQDGRAFIRPESEFHTFPRIAVWPSQTLPQFHLRLTPFIDRMKS